MTGSTTIGLSGLRALSAPAGRVRDPGARSQPRSAMHADPELRRKAAFLDLAVESGTSESGALGRSAGG